MIDATSTGTPHGYLALPPASVGPGVLLLHAWWGLNPFFIELADRLAREGFVVFAPDLNAGEIATTINDAKALMKRRDDAQLAQTVLAAHDLLRTHPAVRGTDLGTLGFSMGAGWAIWLSAEQPASIAATALFYGTWAIDFTPARSAYLGHYAEQDSWEPLDEVRAMETALHAAGRDTTLHFYPGTQHWFMETDRPEYDPHAAELAWQRTIAFFKAKLVA